MQTPLQQLIEQIKKMPAYEFEPLAIGIVEKAESLLPVEKELARTVFEAGADLGYELAGLRMGGKTISDAKQPDFPIYWKQFETKTESK